MFYPFQPYSAPIKPFSAPIQPYSAPIQPFSATIQPYSAPIQPFILRKPLSDLKTNVSNASGFYLRVIAVLKFPLNSAIFHAIREQLRAIPSNGIPIGKPTLIP